VSESSDAFREALGRFASGVVVVTTTMPEGPIGFTASAFSSVSLDPPLVLVCVGKKSSIYGNLLRASLFGVSVLDERQAWIADQFARPGVDRFVGVRLRSATRVPLIEGAIAQLECSRHAVHDAGDHAILVGEVLESVPATGRPLVHYARAFGGFAVEPAAPPHRNGFKDAVSAPRRAPASGPR
jgi:flavin reductase (DIM6/NTAB) family NADH-FMN oxidoreductase RutF